MRKFKLDIQRHIPIVISIIALIVSIIAVFLSSQSLRFEKDKVIFEKTNELLLLSSELSKLYFQEWVLLMQVLDDIETKENITEEERVRDYKYFKRALESNRKSTEDFWEFRPTSVGKLWESDIKTLEANVGLLKLKMHSVRNSIESITKYISEHQEGINTDNTVNKPMHPTANAPAD